MKILASKSIYWMFALKIIGRNEIANWADSLILNGFNNEILFDLSTCSQMDDNEVMSNVKLINYENSKETIAKELLNSLREFYLNIDNRKLVNLSMLSDFERIDDLGSDIRYNLAWLVDDLILQRKGIKVFSKSESDSILEEIDKMLKVY